MKITFYIFLLFSSAYSAVRMEKKTDEGIIASIYSKKTLSSLFKEAYLLVSHKLLVESDMTCYASAFVNKEERIFVPTLLFVPQEMGEIPSMVEKRDRRIVEIRWGLLSDGLFKSLVTQYTSFYQNQEDVLKLDLKRCFLKTAEDFYLLALSEKQLQIMPWSSSGDGEDLYLADDESDGMQVKRKQ